MRLTAKAFQKLHLSEEQIQIQVVDWLNVAKPDCWWTHIGHGGGGKLRGARLKRMGMKSGVPDFLFVHQGRALFIEMKAHGNYQSDAQKAIAADLLAHRAPVTVCRSVDDVRTALAAWGVLFGQGHTGAERRPERSGAPHALIDP